jgi:hypothetical protein
VLLRAASLAAVGAAGGWNHTGLPVDGVIRVFLTGGFPEPLRAALASEYRLRDASGAVVPLAASVTATRPDLRPRAPLSPGARYVLDSVLAYDGSGQRVSDSEPRAAATRASGGVARVGPRDHQGAALPHRGCAAHED